MKFLKYLLLALLAILLVTLALANRELVALELLPRGLTELFGFQARVALPLFVVILGGVVIGLLIGFVWEWLREHRYRRAAEVRRREVNMLAHENERLRVAALEGDDEVVALLEQPPVRPAR